MTEKEAREIIAYCEDRHLDFFNCSFSEGDYKEARGFLAGLDAERKRTTGECDRLKAQLADYIRIDQNACCKQRDSLRQKLDAAEKLLEEIADWAQTHHINPDGIHKALALIRGGEKA